MPGIAFANSFTNMIFKKKKTMQEKDFNAETGAEAQNAADEAAEAMAHGMNTDDSLSETSFRNEEAEAAGMQKELDEAKDKYLRLAADFDNYKRRTAKEYMEMRQTAGREAIQAMIPVLDDCERAEKMLQKAQDVAAVKEGVQLVINKLRSTLTNMGLRRMESAGEPFDAELHEAITEIPAADESGQGKIMDVVEPGYYLNEKLIRYAKVVVGK